MGRHLFVAIVITIGFLSGCSPAPSSANWQDDLRTGNYVKLANPNRMDFGESLAKQSFGAGQSTANQPVRRSPQR